MPQKKKRRVPWNKINNQQNSAASASSWSQGLPVAVPGPSGNTQAYQAELAKLYPLAAPNPSQSTTNSTQSPQFGRPSNRVFLGLPSLPHFTFHVPFPNATHFGQGNIFIPVNPNSAEGRTLSFPSPSGPNFFARLKTDILLIIMENLPGEDVLALRRAVPLIMRILATNDQTSQIWRTVRLAAGVPAVEGGEQRPSPSELTEIRYVLETHCMACGYCHAYRQWDFGFRLCSACLTPRVTTFRDFLDEHDELVNDWGNLREGIPWVAASDVPGLVGVGGALVARKTWADKVARELKFSISGRKQKQIKNDTENISSHILESLKASRSFALSIAKLQPARISGALAFNRLARQRHRWFTARLLAMTSMNFTIMDIPRLQESEWRKIIYKLSEPGQESEWNERQTRLRLMVKTKRNKRLAVLLRGHPPPRPYAEHAGFTNTDKDISHHTVGGLPAFVFLEICKVSDAKTVMRLEMICSAARFILRSSAAETTWRHLRLSAGLEAKYVGWSERQFLSFAFRRLCHCGSEGVTLWTFATTLCGDCFAEYVIESDEVPPGVSRSLKRVIPSVHPEVYAARGWVSLPADGVRLLSRDYVEAIQLWISQIPAATQTQLPPDFLSEYFEEITVKLRRVIQLSEKWEEEYRSQTAGVRRRREIEITRKIQMHNPEFNVSSKVRGELRWKKLVNLPHPLSGREWNLISSEALKIGRAGY